MSFKNFNLMLASVACVGLFSVCTSCTQNNGGENFGNVPDSIQGVGSSLDFSDNVVNDMIQNISSPVEMANQIKNTGVAFDQSVLNDPDKMKDYNTAFKRALNLGVYSADLGYINTFNKNTVVLSYLLSVKELADGIKVGQFLDFNTLSRLAKTNTNLDSLKQLSVSSFNEMDRYLREQRRASVSTAIVAGAWAEGIYITCRVIEQTNDHNLEVRLAEQKEIVDILLIILRNYAKSDNEYGQLVAHANDLKKLYEEVHVTHEFGEPETIEVDGQLVIVQKDVTHVNYTPETISAIISKVKELRAFMVQ